MPVYDDEMIKAREGQAAGRSVPSSDGSPHGLNQYDPSIDADATSGGRHNPAADRGLAKQLQKQERQPAGESTHPGIPSIPPGGGFGSALKALGKFFWGSNRRKAITSSSGGVGMIVLILMWMFNFSTGPLTFIQIGKLLDHNFAVGNHQSDEVVGKMIAKKIFGSPDDVKDSIGNDRLSYLGVIMKSRILKQLKAKGITPRLKSDGFSFDGFEIDPANANSPYNDIFSKGSYDDARVIESLKSALDPNDKLNLDITASDGKIFVKGNQTFFSDTGIKAMSDLLTTGDHPVFNPVWDYIRVRTLSRWSIAGNFHWVAKADAKITGVKDSWVKAGATWIKERIWDPIKKGLNGNTSDGLEVKTTDSNGNPVDGPIEGEGPITEAAAEGFLSDPKGFIHGAGVGASVVAVAAAIICILKTINESVGIIRWGQVIRPLMTMSAVPMSVSSQLMASQDVDGNELSTLANSTFDSYDKAGNVSSTWFDGAAIRALAGETGGTDMNQGIKDILHNGDIPWLDWTKSDAVQTLCSAGAQVALTGIGLALMAVPGVGVVSTIVGAIAGVAIFGGGTFAAVHFLPGILAGHGINIEANGEEWGNDIAYGARLQANQNMLAKGGVALTTPQENQLTAEANAQDREQFHSESLADRIFNASDYRSVVGNMIDNLGIYNMQDLVAKVGDIPNIIGSLSSLPAALISASVHADSTYQYPFPMVGFSDADMNSSVMNQPFQNANQVSAILDNEESSGNHTYIDKALNCFSVAITQGDHGWQAVPTTAPSTDGQDDHTFGADPYDSSHYDKYNCGDTSDTNWFRIRVWIFDLSNMEGYACSQGDETSCENSGFITASTTITPGTVTFVSQNDPQWANSTINTGKTMSQDGCVLAVESMVVSTLTGNFVSPVELDQKYGGNNDPYSHYNLNASGMWANKKAITPATTASMQQVISTIKAGGLVAVYAFNDSTQPFWGTPGHEELIRGIAPDGNLLVYDPWDMPDSSNHFIPNASYPNDSHKHSASEYPPSNFIQPGVSFDFITKGN